VGQTDCFPYQLLHCNTLSPLSVSFSVVLTLVFATGLAETTPTYWTQGEKFLLALFYLIWAGCLITVYYYWYGFPLCSQSPLPVTYTCTLLRQEVLSAELCFSILTIPVQTLSLGHALTTTPPI
jgi:hypothetical protein